MGGQGVLCWYELVTLPEWNRKSHVHGLIKLKGGDVCRRVHNVSHSESLQALQVYQEGLATEKFTFLYDVWDTVLW
jgi:hypothetical protein